MTHKHPRRKYRRPSLTSRRGRALDPHRAAKLIALAEAHLATGDAEAAAQVRRSALVLDPDAPGAVLGLAQALYQAGDFEAALTWLARLSGQPEAELLKGRVLADLPAPAQAVEAFGQVLKADPTRIEARIRRAAVRLAQGDGHSALPDLDAALKQRPNNTWARTLRATALLETDHPRRALADLAAVRATARTATHVLLEARASLLAGLGDQAVDDVFAAGRQHHPADVRLRLAHARHLFASRGRDPHSAERARILLAETLDLPGLPRQSQAEALFALAELETELASDFDLAESLFQRGLGLAPDKPIGLAGLGCLLLRQGRPAHALPWLLRAALVDPERPATIELLSQALPVLTDDEASARWLGLLMSGVPSEAPRLLARLLRYVQESGRAAAYEDVRRQAHRMKNRAAVLASRARMDTAPQALGDGLDELYEQWARFLKTIALRPAAPRLLSVARLLRRAVEQAVAEPERLRLTLPAGLPLIRGDDDQLIDALANLISNAMQASPRERPVRIAARAKATARWVEIAISDEGPGIAPEDRARIFEPGYTTKGDGSGVGLAVAHRAVLSHGGRLSVATAVGGPTTFSMHLPVASDRAPASLVHFEIHALERLSTGDPADQGA